MPRRSAHPVMQRAREDAMAYLTAIHGGDSYAAREVFSDTPQLEAFAATLALMLLGSLDGLEEAGLQTVDDALQEMGKYVVEMGAS